LSRFPIFEEVSTSGSKDKILYFPKRRWICLLPGGWYCKKKFKPVLCLIFFIFSTAGYEKFPRTHFVYQVGRFVEPRINPGVSRIQDWNFVVDNIAPVQRRVWKFWCHIDHTSDIQSIKDIAIDRRR
jgi:hypothetical protein